MANVQNTFQLASLPPAPPASSQPTTNPTPAVSSLQQSPGTTTRNSRTWAKFKGVLSGLEVWILYITIISLAITIIGLPYMLQSNKDSHDSLALAKWTAVKDFRDHCSSLYETTTESVPIACVEALKRPLPPPPLQKRLHGVSDFNSLDHGLSLATFRALSSVAACLGLAVAFIGLTARLVMNVPHLRSADRPISYRALHQLTTSSLTTFNDTMTHVPVSLARATAYSSAIYGQQLFPTQLRRRMTSQYPYLDYHEADAQWESAGKSILYEDDDNVHESDTEAFNVPLPDSDSDSDTNSDNDSEPGVVHKPYGADRDMESRLAASGIALYQQIRRRAKSGLYPAEADSDNLSITTINQLQLMNEERAFQPPPPEIRELLKRTARMEPLRATLRKVRSRTSKTDNQKSEGAARAYQFGNKIIVEDEEGEVIKKYSLPDNVTRSGNRLPDKEEPFEDISPRNAKITRENTEFGITPDEIQMHQAQQRRASNRYLDTLDDEKPSRSTLKRVRDFFGRLTITRSYTKDREDGPAWMDRLPRISTTGRTLSQNSTWSMDNQQPMVIPKLQLRRQKEEEYDEKAPILPAYATPPQERKRRESF